VIVADTLTGCRKPSAPSRMMLKFTGTVAHGKGGVLFFTPMLKPEKSRYGCFDLSTAGAKLFSKILLENFAVPADK
jgi:hypothetical protein